MPDVCPWWVGHLMASSFRRWWQNPQSILSPYVSAGMTVLEPGPAMGFFTLDLARLVGPAGRVVAVNLQERMLAALRRRAAKAGVLEQIETRCVTTESLGVADLAGRVDLLLAFYMVHELPDAARFFTEAHAALKPGGRILFVEPKHHVSADVFAASVKQAEAQGFASEGQLAVRFSRGVVLKKNRA